MAQCHWCENSRDKNSMRTSQKTYSYFLYANSELATELACHHFPLFTPILDSTPLISIPFHSIFFFPSCFLSLSWCFPRMLYFILIDYFFLLQLSQILLAELIAVSPEVDALSNIQWVPLDLSPDSIIELNAN